MARATALFAAAGLAVMSTERRWGDLLICENSLRSPERADEPRRISPRRQRQPLPSTGSMATRDEPT